MRSLTGPGREVIYEELSFELILEPVDGSPPVQVNGFIDRNERLPGGGIKVID